MRSLFARAVLCLSAAWAMQAQNSATNPPHPTEFKGMPPRAAPGDYPSHAQAGDITIAAEFAGHSVPRPEGPLSTEDFIVVEAGLFGEPGAHLTISPGDFSLHVNDKKGPLPSSPVVVVYRSLRDPEWVSPEETKPKAKTSFGGGGGANDTATLPPKVPIELQRSYALYVQKAALPEGDRALPAAGLLFFRYTGKRQSIHSLELIYSGPAGKAEVALQP
ncbi:MAG: hypothetical protein JO051_05610 [Acidobacteriaceae bacterium]|nr:hypothetical protein [Acidobacteriaceae bacterium]